MTHGKRRRGRRPAFTLIELLVVIAIIAILMALTGAAVMRVVIKGPEMQTFSDINNMTTTLTAEQQDLGLSILPSHLRLREDNNYSSGNAAIQADYNLTKGFLTQAFGRHATDYPCPAPGYIDWNGNGKNDNGDMVLEGEQCLVFWLGGAYKQDPATGTIGMTGFPPLLVGGATGKKGPFYEFQPARLKLFAALDPLSGPPATPSLPFPVYLDPWKAGTGKPWGQGMPYVFFASYRTEGLGLYQADCPSLGQAPFPVPGPAPYQDPTGKWMNAGKFQILSAGRDGVFGPGGVFDPKIGASAAAAKDDQSNFSRTVLGNPAN
jgi:prepilin-type N-terminal cleavage/methylation domain-containing protein